MICLDNLVSERSVLYIVQKALRLPLVRCCVSKIGYLGLGSKADGSVFRAWYTD